MQYSEAQAKKAIEFGGEAMADQIMRQHPGVVVLPGLPWKKKKP